MLCTVAGIVQSSAKEAQIPTTTHGTASWCTLYTLLAGHLLLHIAEAQSWISWQLRTVSLVQVPVALITTLRDLEPQ